MATDRAFRFGVGFTGSYEAKAWSEIACRLEAEGFSTLLVVIRWLEDDAELLAEKSVAGKKLAKAVHEFWGYINANQGFIVNYGERYRNGETISSAFAESTVNEVVSKRFEKKQSMRWTKEGTHRLLQVRIQVLDGELPRSFERWYPGMLLAMPEQEVKEEQYGACAA